MRYFYSLVGIVVIGENDMLGQIVTSRIEILQVFLNKSPRMLLLSHLPDVFTESRAAGDSDKNSFVNLCTRSIKP